MVERRDVGLEILGKDFFRDVGKPICELFYVRQDGGFSTMD